MNILNQLWLCTLFYSFLDIIRAGFAISGKRKLCDQIHFNKNKKNILALLLCDPNECAKHDIPSDLSLPAERKEWKHKDSKALAVPRDLLCDGSDKKSRAYDGFPTDEECYLKRFKRHKLQNKHASHRKFYMSLRIKEKTVEHVQIVWSSLHMLWSPWQWLSIKKKLPLLNSTTFIWIETLIVALDGWGREDKHFTSDFVERSLVQKIVALERKMISLFLL